VVGELDEAEALSRETIETAAANGDRRTESLAIIEHARLDALLHPESFSAEEIGRTAQASLAVFEELGDDFGLSRAWQLTALVDEYACRYDAVAEVLERALPHARGSGDDQEQQQVVTGLIASLYYGATPASDGIVRIEALMTEVSARGEATALSLLAGLHTMQERFEDGRALYEKSKEIRRELGLTLSMAAGTQNVREIHLLAGELEEAERELRWGYETLERLGERGYRSTLAGSLAEALYLQGRQEEAEHFAGDCLEAASPEDIASQVGGRTVKAKLLALSGRHDDAEHTVREAVRLAERTDHFFTLGQAYTALAEVLLLGDRGEEAVGALEAAADASERKGNVVTAEKARSMIASLRLAHSTDARN
jgi:tetratricopeptide (TPR) repeat protein